MRRVSGGGVLHLAVGWCYTVGGGECSQRVCLPEHGRFEARVVDVHKRVKGRRSESNTMLLDLPITWVIG